VIGIVWLLKNRSYGRTTTVFRRLQIISAGFVALTHGTNDAQKTMGIIGLALVAAHPEREFHVPWWVITSAAIAMALGTYVGGWRIIRTLGQRIAHLEPHQGFAAETATAGILYTTAHLGFPVSTTHTISGSVLGAGAARHFSAVRWGIAGNILLAWLFTIPAAATVGGLVELLTRAPGGETVVLVLALALALVALVIATEWHRRWRPGDDAASLVAPPA